MRDLKVFTMWIGAIGVVAVLVAAANIWPRASTVSVPPPTATPVELPSPSTASLPVSTSSPSVTARPVAQRVVLGWPGTRVGPAGVYSWTGDPAWMHNATETSVGVSMTFSSVVIDQATRPTTGAETRSEWTTEEAFISSDSIRTERWTADFENRRVTIKVEAERDTTPADLAEAHVIIKSIRSEPTDAGAFRLTFTLPGGWDSG